MIEGPGTQKNTDSDDTFETDSEDIELLEGNLFCDSEDEDFIAVIESLGEGEVLFDPSWEKDLKD